MEKRLLSREFRLKLRKVYYCVLENVNKTFYCHLKASFRSFKTYVYTFYSYTSISCTFILFITLHQPTASTFPSLLCNFFFCSSLRRNINVISHITIAEGFRFNRSGLENERTKATGFFPNLQQKQLK